MCKYLEVGRVGVKDSLLIESLFISMVFIFHQPPPPTIHADDGSYFRKFFLQDDPEIHGGSGPAKIKARLLLMATHSVDSFVVDMVLIISKIVLQDQQQKDTYGNS